MKQALGDYAVLGGKPAFSTPLHVAQINLPEWGKAEAAFRGIFDRHYFANHGPLAAELDRRFAEYTGVRHAVSVTNGTIALMILARALELHGEVIVPAFTFPATVQALSWAGLVPVFCDVDANTHMVTAATVRPLINERTAAILGVHLWGRVCDVDGLQALADKHKLQLFFDGCHGVGCSHGGRRIGTFGAGEAFSFHATKVLNSMEGGCITTNDDQLAQRLRTIRSFHPSQTFAAVPLRMNGKISEIQAAMALLSLDDLALNIAANRRRYHAYREALAGVPGISLVAYDDLDENNYQYVVLEVDEEAAGLQRDELLQWLAMENVFCRRHFYPGVHRMEPYRRSINEDRLALPQTERLCRRLLQLPSGQVMSDDDVLQVSELIRSMVSHGPMLRSALRSKS